MSQSNADRILHVGLTATAMIAAGAVLLIAGFVAMRAWPALHHIGPLHFMTDAAWRPTSETHPGFSVIPMLVASALVTMGAVAIAGPLGLLSAIFLHHYSPPILVGAMRRLLELLNGVPSVLFGLWGLVVVAPLINELHPPGQSLLAGIIVLALMILPTIALSADAALGGVPPEQLRAAAALGIGRFTTIRSVVLPAARRGIIAGSVLGAARAIGETMAVVMVCGNIVQIPGSLFDPVRTVTANIALEMGYATAEHRSALFVTGLLLMLLIGIVILATTQRGERTNATL